MYRIDIKNPNIFKIGLNKGEEIKPLIIDHYGEYFESDSYLITSHGRIYSKMVNRFLSLVPNSEGYAGTALTYFYNGKKFERSIKVHRMVAIAFIPNPDNLPEVNHKKLGFAERSNNRVDNLEWASRRENIHHRILNGDKYRDLHIYTDEMNNFLLGYMNDHEVWYKDELVELFKNKFNLTYTDRSISINIRELLAKHKGKVNLPTRRDMFTKDKIILISEMLSIDNWDIDDICYKIYKDSYDPTNIPNRMAKRKKILEIYKRKTFHDITKNFDFKPGKTYTFRKRKSRK